MLVGLARNVPTEAGGVAAPTVTVADAGVLAPPVPVQFNV
jgi:hypothetical protein